MVKGLYTAYTGMINEQKRLDVTANNLANASTTGYKKEGMVNQSFDSMLTIKIKDTSTAGTGIQSIGTMSLGVKVGETYTDWSQGSFQITDNSTDLALSGYGFFAISFTNSSGETSIKYTRDGCFTMDTEGYLRTTDGDYLLNMTGAINSENIEDNYVKLDPTMDFTVDSLGYVYQNDELVTQIGYIDVADYDYINKYGENLYDLIDGAEIIESSATIEQGALETSNVNVVDEMVAMITIARAYEAGQKVIQAEDSALDKAVNQVGKV